MPVPPRCPFHQDACSTKMPVPPRCLFHQDACSTHWIKQHALRCIQAIRRTAFLLQPSTFSVL
ncbi:hypothetical protein [Moorena sp. SIO3H5]|uniref:hypothetical protein n=1 Tax=Moorena sp. SIO3H5 TaxID=2607834 RepID=UPI0013B7AA64|nr:hypothetical protein [Moorena sp. SIO3H5]NEO74190.1 hypothetical protein [Moorena sp. SIO3H5]